MEIADVVALAGLAITLGCGIIGFVVQLREARRLAKQASSDVSQLQANFNTLQRDVDKHSVRINNIHETTRKQEARLTRLENHSFNI